MASIECAIADGVATITLNRPDALNALGEVEMAELADVVRRVAVDTSVRAVLLTGAGRAFCAGGDVKRMLSGWGDQPGSREAGALTGAGALHEAVSGLRRMPKPVLCAVNGVAAGAGVGIALAGDIVWAAESATLTLAYTAIGLSPDGGTTFFLPRAVGPTRAMEYFLTNRKLSAAEALQVGMLSRVFPDDELLPEARALVQRLAQGPTRAYAEVKSLVSASLRNGLETQLENERQGIVRSVSTDDFAEGVAAFVAKRSPRFQGT
jgi:2-(1,2-epoxy-1,2-dihydrophenyl)acetyl-CoA isomerase